ncbi:MAG: amidohydrolase [Armatimonadota bacterium]
MILRAHVIVPVTEDPIEGGEIFIKNGRIEAIGEDLSASLPDEPVEDLGHAAILPGLVNAHTHLDYTVLRGMVDDEPFMPWIRRLTDIGKEMQQEDFLASARLGLLQLVRSGVTAIGDSTFSGAVVEAAREAGLRGIVYQETFGADPTQDYKDQVDLLAEKVTELRGNSGDRITIGVSPHSVYTSSERLLRLVADLALDQGLPVALHVSETRDEVVLIESAEGHIADFYKLFRFDFEARGMSPVAYLHDIGLLNSNTLAAHCVHINDNDLDMLAASGTRVAHCPKSNAKLAVGTAPLESIIERGILTGIGTDSAASNNALDMFEEMRFAVLAQRAINEDVNALNAKQILELATLGGAAALGMDSEIGSLEPGKQADIIAVDLSSPAVFPTIDPYSALVYCCSACDVMMNMIGGEIIYRSGQYFKVDADEINRQASLTAAKIAPVG